jgi:hypothetical protein
MRNVAASAILVCGVVAGSTIIAAPGTSPQTYTIRPGDPTPAIVWVQNTPLSVAVATMPPVTLSGTPVVQATIRRQEWEYRIITVTTGQDAAPVLTSAGAEGWEATGAQLQSAAGVALLFKRPR